MPNIRTFRTRAGQEMVLIPRVDYEVLVKLAEEAMEDAADVAIYDERKAEFGADTVTGPHANGRLST